MSAGWRDVLDVQHDIWRFGHSELGERYARGFSESVNSSVVTMGDADLTGDASWARTYYLVRLAFESIRACDPFFIADDMMDVLESAVAGFKPEPLLPTDIITRAGFVLLPRPLYLPDRWGKEVAYRAFSWVPAQTEDGAREGVLLAVWSHRDDEDAYHDPNDPESPIVRAPESFTLAHLTPWWFDVDVDFHLQGSKIVEDDPQAALGFHMLVRDVQAFFRLTMQHISIREQWDAPRSSRRRVGRDLFPEKKITVVKLRRPRSKSDEHLDGTVEWSHRWIVDGHWREQWYPSLNTHRQIWIGAYVKGPEDKELRIRRGRAFKLVR